MHPAFAVIGTLSLPGPSLSPSPSHLSTRLRYSSFPLSVLRFPVLCIQGSGGHLLSRTVSSEVPSAVCVLTVVFGMGTGVSRIRIATRSIEHLVSSRLRRRTNLVRKLSVSLGEGELLRSLSLSEIGVSLISFDHSTVKHNLFPTLPLERR